MEKQPAPNTDATQIRTEQEPLTIPLEFTVVMEALQTAVQNGSHDEEVEGIYRDAIGCGVRRTEVRILHMFARADGGYRSN